MQCTLSMTAQRKCDITSQHRCDMALNRKWDMTAQGKWDMAALDKWDRAAQSKWDMTAQHTRLVLDLHVLTHARVVDGSRNALPRLVSILAPGNSASPLPSVALHLPDSCKLGNTSIHCNPVQTPAGAYHCNFLHNDFCPKR